MLPKNEVLLDPNDFGTIIFITSLDMLKNLDLYGCLVMELLLIPDDLQSDFRLVLMIHTFMNLSK